MKILVVVKGFAKGGGLSQWVLDYYNALSNRNDLSIDFLSEDGLKMSDDFVLSNSINIISIPSVKKNFFKYYFDWKKISQNSEENYDYIHIHTDNLVRFIYLALLRKKNNVIIHSHNAFNDFVERSFIKKSMHRIGKKIIKKGKFTHFACSDLAAQWLFDDQSYIQVNNGIVLKKFRFDEGIRVNKIKEFDLCGKTIYGNIGRFSYQKNHEQLIDIFKAIHDQKNDTVLLLIGSGELENNIKEKVAKYGLTNDVLFLGLRNDVSELLNVIDYFILPSYYEGFPISMVEAQANGIPVFFSNTITKDAQLLPESFSFSLNDSVESIAKEIINKSVTIDRHAANRILKEAGFDQSDVVEWLYQYYKGEISK